MVRLHSHTHRQVGFSSLCLWATIFHFTHGTMRIHPHCFITANVPQFLYLVSLTSTLRKRAVWTGTAGSLMKRLVKESYQRWQVLFWPCKLMMYPHSCAYHKLHPYDMEQRDHSCDLTQLDTCSSFCGFILFAFLFVFDIFQFCPCNCELLKAICYATTVLIHVSCLAQQEFLFQPLVYIKSWYPG